MYVPNNQNISPQASGTLLSSLGPLFKSSMDTVLLGGRDITLNLPPVQSICPNGCKLNSTYNKFLEANGKICTTCKGQGYVFEHRYTTYLANIRWTNELLYNAESNGQNTTAGKMLQNMVRTKTVIESLNHIKQAISADIDGVSCILWEEPRVTGWGNDLYYVVTLWKINNK